MLGDRPDYPDPIEDGCFGCVALVLVFLAACAITAAWHLAQLIRPLL